MEYAKVKEAVFIARPNRFIAQVLLDGREERVHVKNTGRCRELLQPGARVFLEPSAPGTRKTAYSLTAVYKGDRLVNIDSQAPNKVVYEGLTQGQIPEIGPLEVVKREVTFQSSRFDLYFEDHQGQKGFVEVKGVTLEDDGLALFPDAPTARGTKHVYELIEAVEAGYRCFVFFLIQMTGIRAFTPNQPMDPAFSAALAQARRLGVGLLAYDTRVTTRGMTLGQRIPILSDNKVPKIPPLS